MPRGGPRPGSGRPKKSSKTALMAKKTAMRVLDNGTSPLDYMLKVMNGQEEYDYHRFKAAAAAAPYVHPRLQAVEHSGEIVSKHEQAIDELEKLALDNVELAASSSPDNDLDELESRVLN